MSLTTDISTDYLAFDATETVTLTTPTVTDTSVTALRHVLSRKDLLQMGPIGVEADYLVFNLFIATFSITTPNRGDTITDADGVVYTIQGLEKLTLGSRWRAVCCKQR